MQIDNVNAALLLVRDSSAAQNRDLIREAATFLSRHQNELTVRVTVRITAEEMSDPAWSDVVGKSRDSCVCERPECSAQYLRVFGPPRLPELVDGETVIVKAGSLVWLRLKGTRTLLQSIDSSNNTLEIRTGDEQPERYPLAPIVGRLLADLSPEKRTRRTQGAECFRVAVSRLESFDAQNNALTITLDADVEPFVMREALFVAGDTITLEPDKKLYLRIKGDEAALVVLWVHNHALFHQRYPFDKVSWMTSILRDGGPRSFTLGGLQRRLMALSHHLRLVSFATNVLPLPLLHLDAVSIENDTITVTLDQSVESCQPPEELASFLHGLDDLFGIPCDTQSGAPAMSNEAGNDEKASNIVR